MRLTQETLGKVRAIVFSIVFAFILLAFLLLNRGGALQFRGSQLFELFCDAFGFGGVNSALTLARPAWVEQHQ